MSYTFNIPNVTASDSVGGEAYSQAYADAVDFQVMQQGVAGNGIISGGAITASGSTTVTVAALTGILNQVPFQAPESTTLTVANNASSNFRFDLIVYRVGSGVILLQGTPETPPNDPKFTAFPPPTWTTDVLMAAIYVASGTPAITSAEIIGKAAAMPPLALEPAVVYMSNYLLPLDITNPLTDPYFAYETALNDLPTYTWYKSDGSTLTFPRGTIEWPAGDFIAGWTFPSGSPSTRLAQGCFPDPGPLVVNRGKGKYVTRLLSCFPDVFCQTVGHGNGNELTDTNIHVGGKWDDMTLDGTFAAGGATGYEINCGEQTQVTNLAIHNFGPCPGPEVAAVTVGGATLAAGGWGIVSTVAGSKSTAGWSSGPTSYSGWGDGGGIVPAVESQISPEQQVITTSGQGISITPAAWFTPQPPWGFNLYARPVAQVSIGSSTACSALTSLTVNSATPITAANEWNQAGGTLVVIATPGSGPLSGVPGFAQFSYSSITGTTFNGLVFQPEATTVGSGSNGGTIANIATWGGTYGGNGVLDVGSSTSNWPSTGTLVVETTTTNAIITYAGVSGSTFTGCVYVSGGVGGTVATGYTVIPQGGTQTTVPASALVANGNVITGPNYQQIATNVAPGTPPTGTAYVWSTGSYVAAFAPESINEVSTNLYLTAGGNGISDGGKWTEKGYYKINLEGGGNEVVFDGANTNPGTTISFEYNQFHFTFQTAGGQNAIVLKRNAWLNNCVFNLDGNHWQSNDGSQGIFLQCLTGGQIDNCEWRNRVEAGVASTPSGQPASQATWLQPAQVFPIIRAIDVTNGSNWQNVVGEDLWLSGSHFQPTLAIVNGALASASNLAWGYNVQTTTLPGPTTVDAGNVSITGVVYGDSELISLAHAASSSRNPVSSGTGPVFLVVA